MKRGYRISSGKSLGPGSILGIAGVGLLAASAPARALTINPMYDSSITSLANAADIENAFAIAASRLENLFADPITVNIEVQWGQTNGHPVTGVGQSLIQVGPFRSYAGVQSLLQADATTSVDAEAVSAGGSVSGADPTGGGTFVLPVAEARALGVVAGDAPMLDGYVGFNSSVTYTFDPNNRAVAGAYDFIGIAEHEISEVLGRTSQLTNSGFLSNGYYLPYDLFRFTGVGAHSLDPNATGVYFSLDNGVTDLKNYNPPGGGDISDWLAGITDAFDAFIGTGMQKDISAVDIAALDAIGYDAVLPEPAGLLLAPVWLAGMRWARRRRL